MFQNSVKSIKNNILKTDSSADIMFRNQVDDTRATLCLRPIRPWPWGATALGGAKFVENKFFENVFDNRLKDEIF